MPGLFALPVSVNQAGALADDRRDVVPGLDVVDVRRLAVEPFWAGNGGRGRGRPEWPSSDAMSAVSSPQTNAPAPSTVSMSNVEAAAEDVLAEDAVRPRLLDRALEADDRERVLGADVDDPLARAGDVARDEHPLEERVGVGLDLVAVHVRAGIALVRVADEVLLRIRPPSGGTPTCCR